MSKTEFKLHGFNEDGLPIMEVKRDLAGRRNRQLRREGASDVLKYGDPADVVDEPHAAMLFIDERGETWGFAKGTVYKVQQIVDGTPREILIDAREDNVIHGFRDGIEMDSWSFKVEGAPTENTPTENATTEDTLVEDPETDSSESEAPSEETPSEATETDSDEESTGEHDFDGTIAEFEELIDAVTDDELERLSQGDSRKGIRERALEELTARQDAPGENDPED